MMPNCLECKTPLSEDDFAETVLRDDWKYFFCSVRCKDNYVHPNLTNRICAREGCGNRVPEGNRMLCLECHIRGDNLREPSTWFDETDRALWESGNKAMLKRLEEQVRVFSSDDMTQEELRALVPSLQQEAA
ncbi:MAG: hypothetical protein JSU72_15565 [Deltaproteobacteria bacterium]|nr:MAG: hypothetical protein JSU72_15565 [Deltaproteobacteria bacterium]